MPGAADHGLPSQPYEWSRDVLARIIELQEDLEAAVRELSLSNSMVTNSWVGVASAEEVAALTRDARVIDQAVWALSELRKLPGGDRHGVR